MSRVKWSDRIKQSMMAQNDVGTQGKANSKRAG